LLEKIIAVRIVAGHLDSNHIRARATAPLQRPFVDTIKSMRSARWPIPQKFSVEKQAINAGPGQPKHGLLYVCVIDHDTKSGKQIAFQFAPL